MNKSRQRTTLAHAHLMTLVAMMVVVILSSRAAAQDHGLSWTGTWATSPMRDDAGKGFNRQTLRQIVHTSVGGQVARIHISNLFGAQPLTVADVHIAQRSADSSIVAATDQKVQFGGLFSVTVQPGTEAISDPVDFQVPRQADVAISIYLPNPTGLPTYHPSGFQTNYTADGDVSGLASLSGVKTTQSYYFLINLDVQNKAVRGSVVTLGASITDGYASTADTNRRWPNDLAQKLLDAGLNIGVLNQGISGNRLLAAGAGDSAETRFDRDVLNEPGVRWVIFSDDPINDLGSTAPPPTADQLIAGIGRLIARAHQKQIKFVCSTLTPYQGAAYWTSAGEAAREQINSFLRSRTSGCDAVVDQDAATHDPLHPAQFLPAYDSGDHLHPNEAGLQAIADAVNLSLFSHPGFSRTGAPAAKSH
ncbi:SGNH/GDSL hydrolase family protein [Acidicapsa acidisoli]|uniref:SGNH/GDSL hydrolase family protein n=1 Tax=Acidicapsa acidisoli TaxID=1615681 RepID=UPI0021E0A9A6|nr:SGNH/GDSL hydrolase family protein [Acidicapsa acidisoli]